MAEQVQAILDRMVPALRDLMDKEVFTQVSHLFCFHCFRYFHRCNILIHILLQINHGPTTNFLHYVRMKSKQSFPDVENLNTFSEEGLPENPIIGGTSKKKKTWRNCVP